MSTYYNDTMGAYENFELAVVTALNTIRQSLTQSVVTEDEETSEEEDSE